jgi:asparagine synthase (glutamine-hydrolysing)
MCGIAGIWDFSGRAVDPADLRRMTDALAHRGPDDQGQWTDGPVGLGHRRLSILDLSASGHQPMADPSGRYVVTYNGEIYNYRAIRAEIERESGARFVSDCDTEILPNGFALWGSDLFARLEGMFALALWDRETQTLTLARDGVGIKPLYLARQRDRLYLASEPKAFTALPDFEARLSPAAMHETLANGYAGPTHSLLQGVAQLPPGSWRAIRADGEKTMRFWHPRRHATVRRMDEAVEAVALTLETVVGDMMLSDVPVGVLQSGGVDSSLISSAARGFDVPLFTAQFEQASFDESPKARMVAAATGLPHHVIPIHEAADPVASFKAMARAYDAHLSDSSGFALYELCRHIRRHVTVVLSGEGGDEFFGGYPTYGASRIAHRIRPFVPACASEAIAALAFRTVARDDDRLPAAEKIGRFFAGLAQPRTTLHAQWRRHLMAADAKALYGPVLRDVAATDPMAGYATAIAAADGETLLDRWLVGDQDYYLPGDMLPKTDRVSMAHGLEVRVPFLDRRMMDLAGGIDASLLTPVKGPPKAVLREALAREAGLAGIATLEKRGFNNPIAAMLRNELRSLSEAVFEQAPDRFAPYLDTDALRRMWRDHDARRANHQYLLWMLLGMAVWFEETGTT